MVIKTTLEESNDPEELIAQAKEMARREKNALKKEAKKAPVVQEKKVTIQANSGSYFFDFSLIFSLDDFVHFTLTNRTRKDDKNLLWQL